MIIIDDSSIVLGIFFADFNFLVLMIWDLVKNDFSIQKINHFSTSFDLDACEKIKCKFGATCKNGRCTCSTYCDKQSDTEDLLCANNNRVFANECDLKRYACLHQVWLLLGGF